ncbi:uncharacterized protein [Salminus brasiliensis]|uniref:uncharacterized protein n=1 Tax=Salminus brasiliensis TaxID=930266 RepID=UPI003B83389C
MAEPGGSVIASGASESGSAFEAQNNTSVRKTTPKPDEQELSLTAVDTITIFPVPKKSTVSCLNDYRSVALTSIIMKCFKSPAYRRFYHMFLSTVNATARTTIATRLNFCRLRRVRKALIQPSSTDPEHLKERERERYCPDLCVCVCICVCVCVCVFRVKHGGTIRIKPGLKKYGCDLTLDPNTAHTRLSLSEGNRKVVCGEKLQSYPDHPERFDVYQQVMSRESLTGRCYWEAEWSGKRVVVALTYKTISRKGRRSDCWFGGNKESWSPICSDEGFSVYHNNNRTDLPPPPSSCRRVGVYVDCPAGTLSFYSVSSDTHTLTNSHTLTHLHTLNTTFTQPLYAGIEFYQYGSSVSLCKIE